MLGQCDPLRKSNFWLKSDWIEYFASIKKPSTYNVIFSYRIWLSEIGLHRKLETKIKTKTQNTSLKTHSKPSLYVYKLPG